MAYNFPPFVNSPTRPGIWTPADIIALLCQPGFMSPDDWRPITGCAIVLAESTGDPLARGMPVWNPTAATHLSIDLGLFQLNSYYHTVTGPYPDVGPISVADCFNPFTAWQQAWKVINKQRPGWNYNWEQWTTYRTGSYAAQPRMSAAYRGMEAYRVSQGLPWPGPFAL